MDIKQLRQETAGDHRAVEGSLPLMDDSLDRTRYIACLQRMYGLVDAWEEHAAAVSPEWLHGTLAARSRRAMLSRDLDWFGATPGTDRPSLPMPSDVAHLLGAMYVMEGSTLGGQFIARHLESVLHLQKGDGNAYFVGHGEMTGGMWKGFCEILSDRVADQDAAAVTQGARTMFTAFGSWMRDMPAADGS